jgi:hypothetical protein
MRIGFSIFDLILIGIVGLLLLIARDSGWRFSLRTLLLLMTFIALLLGGLMVASNSQF